MSQQAVMTHGEMAPDEGKTERHESVSPGEIALAVVIGRTSEFFDFFVYGIASVLVFPKLLFPDAEPLTATLYSFAIFSLAFVARPIGSVLFTEIGRRHGRGVKLTIALFLLGGSTAAISFLPTHAQIGAAAVYLLAAFRIGQGLALAGAWDGLPSLLALSAPEKKKGWYAMMPQLGAPFGFLLAAGLFLFFVGVLSEADFLSWGWRYPFFAAFAINVVALFARLRLVVTKEYSESLESQELDPTSVYELLKVDGLTVLTGAFAPLACFALFHLVTIFPLSWVTLFTDRHAGEFLIIEIIGAFVFIAAIVASGLLADRVGRRRVLGGAAVAIGVYSLFAPWLLGGGVNGEAAFILVGFGLLGLAFGQSSGALSAIFQRRNRYTGSALTSDLAWLIGAGFAPLVALGFSAKFGLGFVALYLLSGVACTLASLFFARQLAAVD